MQPQRRQPSRLPHPWGSLGKNTGVGCHFLLQCMTVKSESEVAQSCPTLRDPMDCSLPGSSIHGIFQARVLEWVAIRQNLPLVPPFHCGRVTSTLELDILVSFHIFKQDPPCFDLLGVYWVLHVCQAPCKSAFYPVRLLLALQRSLSLSLFLNIFLFLDFFFWFNNFIC